MAAGPRRTSWLGGKQIRSFWESPSSTCASPRHPSPNYAPPPDVLPQAQLHQERPHPRPAPPPSLRSPPRERGEGPGLMHESGSVLQALGCRIQPELCIEGAWAPLSLGGERSEGGEAGSGGEGAFGK